MQVRPVVRFEQGSLDHLMQLVRTTNSPTTFDLCSRELCCTDETSLEIAKSNVSFINGSIRLDNEAHPHSVFMFSGTGVELVNLTLTGGEGGVLMLPGGSVTLWNCTLQGMQCGLYTDARSEDEPIPCTIVAHGVKILGCGSSSVRVGLDTHVPLTDCIITGNSGARAITVDGQFEATRLQCIDNVGVGVNVTMLGDATLTDSTFSGNKGGSMKAAAGSKIVMARCTVDSVAAKSSMDGVAISSLNQVRLWVMAECRNLEMHTPKCAHCASCDVRRLCLF